MSKKNSENYKLMLGRWFEHAQQRAMERYGIAYTDEILVRIRGDVKNNVFNKLLDVPNSKRVVLRGRLLDEVVTFIYCMKHNAVITFLHNNWVSTDTEEFYILSSERRKYKKARRKNTEKGANVYVGGHLRKSSSPKPKPTEPSVDDWEV